jgi:UDP-2,3-diacylglucosamine hydrolase
LTDSRKIYFVSDVHLGAPALLNNKERELLFVEWLDHVSRDAGEIYLMGDIFDFWFEYLSVAPRGFTRVLGKIAEIVDRGIPVHFFTGNHDIWVKDYLPSETGVIIHRDILRTVFSGKRFFLAHGDGLDADDKGYILLKKVFTNRFLQRMYSWLHPDLAFSLARYWSKHSREAKRICGPEFKGEDEGLFRFALSEMEKGNYDYFIFGHRHRAADMKIGESGRFILLGEWIRSFSYGVFDGNDFELKYYKSKKEQLADMI